MKNMNFSVFILSGNRYCGFRIFINKEISQDLQHFEYQDLGQSLSPCSASTVFVNFGICFHKAISIFSKTQNIKESYSSQNMPKHHHKHLLRIKCTHASCFSQNLS